MLRVFEFPTLRRFGALILVLFTVSACAASDPASRLSHDDPFEKDNRQMHQFNLDLDKIFVSPVSDGYGTAIPPEIRQTVESFSDNLAVPGDVVNNLLQGDLRGAGHNTVRFLTNSTIGIFGLVDAATILNIERHQTDFGETLHVWGAEEGDYDVLPGFGPSTTRDTAGLAVDIFLNPLNFLNFTSIRGLGIATYLFSRLNDRYEYADTVDSILYESADGYTQTKLLYLQNRRYQLGIIGADAFSDPYSDPYEDPYGY